MLGQVASCPYGRSEVRQVGGVGRAFGRPAHSGVRIFRHVVWLPYAIPLTVPSIPQGDDCSPDLHTLDTTVWPSSDHCSASRDTNPSTPLQARTTTRCTATSGRQSPYSLSNPALPISRRPKSPQTGGFQFAQRQQRNVRTSLTPSHLAPSLCLALFTQARTTTRCTATSGRWTCCAHTWRRCGARRQRTGCSPTSRCVAVQYGTVPDARVGKRHVCAACACA